jgi:hypothetical protein
MKSIYLVCLKNVKIQIILTLDSTHHAEQPLLCKYEKYKLNAQAHGCLSPFCAPGRVENGFKDND